ncbi:MAG: zf-TFIIB domain-containing protein [Novosphingobium sp.]
MHSPFPAPCLQCPACRVPLASAERHGLQIDHCPQCGGLWLERGELDAMVSRGPQPSPDPAPPPPREMGGGGGWLGHFQFPAHDRGFGRKPADAGKRWRGPA